MVTGRAPDEEQVKKRWLEQEYENLRVVESGSAWIGEPREGEVEDIAVFEVPIRGRRSTPAKKIDVVAIHDVHFHDASELAAITQSAWSIADPSNWELIDIGKFVRQILAEMADSPVEVSIYEAKVTLRYGGLGQIQSYPNRFVEDYGDTRDLQIRETGLIYWEIDEIVEEAAANEEIVLYPVEFDPNSLTRDSDTQSSVEDFGDFNLDDQARYQQTPSGSGETRKQQARLDGLDLESRFPQPHKRDQYTRLEAYRRSMFRRPPDPDEFFEEYAEEVLDQNLVLTHEEFVNAQQSPKGSGIGR